MNLKPLTSRIAQEIERRKFIYFAGAEDFFKWQGKKPKIDKGLTPEQESKCEDLKKSGPKGAKIAERFSGQTESGSKVGRTLDEKVFLEMHRLLVVDTGEYRSNGKDKKAFENYVTALEKGKFPEKAEGSLVFLKALKYKNPDGSESEERRFAVETLEKLARSKSGAVPKDVYRDYLAKLRKALPKEESEDEEESDAVEETARSTDIRIKRSDTSSRVEDQLEVRHENWRIELPPKELLEKFRPLDERTAELIFEGRDKGREHENLESKLNITTDTKEREALIAKIAKLQEELEEIDREMEELNDELIPLRQEYNTYQTVQLKRIRAIERLSKSAGLDMQSVRTLITWYKGGTKLSGLEIKDTETGRVINKAGKIEIVGFTFENLGEQEEPDSPGKLIVNYIDEDGNKAAEPFIHFVRQINAVEAYEEKNSMEEFNERRKFELRYEQLKSGQTFAASIYQGTDESGQPIYKREYFQIDEINEIEGEDGEKKWSIKLKDPIVTVPRSLQPESMDKRGYHDRKHTNFTLGQFEKFIMQRGFKRITSADEHQKIVNMMTKDRCNDYNNYQPLLNDSEHNRQRIASITNTLSEDAEGLTLPTKDGEKKNVLWFDQNTSRERVATIERFKDTNGETRYKVSYDTTTDINGPLSMPRDTAGMRLPAGTMAAHQVKGRRKLAPNDGGGKKWEGTWEELDLDSDLLLEAENKGMIRNAPTGADAGGGGGFAGGPGSTHFDEDTGLEVDDSGQPVSPTGGGGSGVFDDFADKPLEERYEEEKENKDLMGEGEEPYARETLPYADIHKVGDMTTSEKGVLAELWSNSRFLSISDLWELGKAGVEYYNKRFERRQKSKYSDVAKDVPFFAPEMKRINQSAENEFVSQFKESFDQYGVFEIQERMRLTRNRDELKAGFTVLTEKGQMRWDDIELWKNINRFADPSVAIPIPSNGDPATWVSEKDQRTGIDFMKGALDSMWGDGTFNDWFNKNKSTYLSNAKSNYETGKELENVQGGPGRKLAELLRRHKMGEFVDPHEYEGLILFIIEYGKGTMQDKIYYMVEGVAAVNSQGRTIMSFDRIAHINSEMMVRFPLLQYMCDPMKRSDGQTHKATIDDYKKWAYMFDAGDPGNPEKCKPSAQVDRFLWDFALPSRSTRQRINKALRDGERIDHDDMYGYIPPATEQVVNDACKSLSGSKKFVTIEGYANVFPGFSEYFRTMAGQGNTTRLRQAVKSYVRYESIMNGRWKKGDESYQRMDDDILRKAPVASDTPPIAYIHEDNKLVKSIVSAYNDPKLNEIAELMYQTTGDTRGNPEEDKKQKKVQYALEKFGRHFDRVVSTDGGAKMLNIVRTTNLIGMDYIPPEVKELRKAGIEAAGSHGLNA